MPDVRRFDEGEKTLRDSKRAAEDTSATLSARLASHIHDPTVTTLVDAKGDLLVGTANDTLARLPVGTSSAVLMVDSSTATGLRWDAGGHEASYLASGTQVIGTLTDTPVQFSITDYSSADVTRGTSSFGLSNSKFTLNRSGLWIIEAGVRSNSVFDSNSSGIWLGPDGGSTRYRASMENSGGTSAMEFSLCCCRRFVATEALNLYFWHNQPGNHSIVPLNQSNSIRLAWIRP